MPRSSITIQPCFQLVRLRTCSSLGTGHVLETTRVPAVYLNLNFNMFSELYCIALPASLSTFSPTAPIAMAKNSDKASPAQKNPRHAARKRATRLRRCRRIRRLRGGGKLKSLPYKGCFGTGREIPHEEHFCEVAVPFASGHCPASPVRVQRGFQSACACLIGKPP